MSAYTLWIILQKEIRDAMRNRWFVMVSVLFALLSVSLSLLGLAGLGSFGIAGFGRTAASLLNLVLLIVPLMGLVLGAMSVAGEREQGTLSTLLAQPVTPNEIFMGKYLGTAIAMMATVLLGFGTSGFVIARYAGSAQIGDYLVLVAFTMLLGLCYLSMGFCISIFSKRHATAIGIALFFWFLFLFLSDLGLMGTSMILKISPKQLFWLVILNPAQVFKFAVVSSLQKSLEAFGSAGLYASEVFGDWFLPLLSTIMIAWIFLPLLAALLFFRAKCAD